MTLPLTDIWPIEEPSLYKLHFARHNRVEQPLDVFVRNREEWQGWQEFRPKSNQFNRPYIFSVIDFYREPDIWLFGGVWEVLERLPDSYVVSLTEQGRDFIGRLKLHSPLPTARDPRQFRKTHGRIHGKRNPAGGVFRARFSWP